MACHDLELCDICYQSVPVEWANENVQGTLRTLWIPRSHHAVVGIEESQTTPYRKSQLLLINQLVLHHQSKSSTYHIIHY